MKIPDKEIEFSIVGYRHAVLSPDDIAFFRGQSAAQQIWSFVMSMDSGWKFRKAQIMDYLGIGDCKWRKATKFLQEKGVMRIEIIRDKKGRVAGRQIFFKSRLDGEWLEVGRKREENTNADSNKTKEINDINRGVENPKCGKPTQLSTSRGIVRGDRGNLGQNEEVKMTDHDRQKMRDEFLSRFSGKHTFQTFDDVKDRKLRSLAKVLHKKNYQLDDLNDLGAGIFFTVNECDGKGRTTANVVRVRSVFVDLDGSPLDPVLPYNPHIVVSSSPGKFHAYWLVDNFPIEAFKPTQQHLAAIFAGDKAVNDLSRVMRLPGYWHRKGEPAMTEVIMQSYHAPLSYAEVVELFPPVVKPKFSGKRYQKPADQDSEWRGEWGTSEGERNHGLAKFCGWMISRNYSSAEYESGAFRWGKSCVPPMPDNEIQHTMQSIARYA